MKITLVLGNQLFSDFYSKNSEILMIEDLGIAAQYRYHRLRILHQFIAMREFRDDLKAKGYQVHYFELPESKALSFFDRVALTLKKAKTKQLALAQIPDVSFRNQIIVWAESNEIDLCWLDSPQFMVSEQQFRAHYSDRKKPFMKTFYEQVRREQKIMVDAKGEPEGGRWSYDVENRKKLPKGYQGVNVLRFKKSKYFSTVQKLVTEYFASHPGQDEFLFLPVNRKDSLLFLEDFLENRFHDFGPYEDAIDPKHDLLCHSGLSSLINLGLLNPKEVIDQALLVAKKSKVPIESCEGFIRQILGWREFIRGIHENFYSTQVNSNFFNHQNKMKPCWYNGTTGLPPVDDAIKKALRLGYNHHIERLMILSNAMLLSEIHPHAVHQWFMEMYLDSYEWVMGPNVYGMGQFSDGGIFATKPYISGSNYILKMSAYPRGEWCEIWDGLYWSFIDRNINFFSKNPRLGMMAQVLKKMDSTKRERLFQLADNFKSTVCIQKK